MSLEKYTHEVKPKGEWKCILLILAIVVLYNSCFGYVNWNSTISGWLKNVISLILIAFLIFHIPKNKYCHFQTEVLLLMIIPYISSINTNLLYGQSFYDSIRVLSSNFVWIFYFVLHKYKVNESTLLKTFLIVSLIILGIQVVQQFTYPNAYFGIGSDDTMLEKGMTESAEQRNGLWRFRMGNNGFFSCVVLFSALIFAKKKMSTKLWVIIAMMFVSIYLMLTRQVIGSCLLTVFLSFFIGKKNKGMIKGLIFGVILAAIIYSYADVLFGSLIQQTSDDLNDSNVRIYSASYFWTESLSSPLTFLIGHGVPNGNSSYSSLIETLAKTMGFYTADVGFVGMIYTYGFFYVFFCYRLLWRLYFSYKNVEPTYIRLFVIYTTLMSIMIFPMYGPVHYLVWSVLMYITDMHVNKSCKIQHKHTTKTISHATV